MYIQNVYTEVGMGEEYRAKVFKSGNSLALRLPKALGLKEGAEMRIREEAGGFVAEPAEKNRKITGVGWMGVMPGLKPLTPEEREFEERELDWEGKLLKRDG
jgi:antitoxin VapB